MNMKRARIIRSHGPRWFTTTRSSNCSGIGTKNKAKVVVVGSGRMGQIRASLLQGNPRFDLRGIVDINLQSARALADEYGLSAYESLDAAFDGNRRLDGIIVSSPTFTHQTIIRQAADAKVSVFCEKPVEETADQIQALFEYAHEAGIHLCCGFQRRFDPSYVAARQALQDKTSSLCGTPIYASLFFADHPRPSHEFLLTGGNIFMDLSAHDVDFITHALQDSVISVYATGTSSDAELAAAGVHDNATMIMKMKKGTVATLFMSRSASYGYDQRCEIFGTEGLIQIGNVHEHSTVISSSTGIHASRLQHSFPQRFHHAFGLELDAFADTILSDDVEWPVTAQQCIHVQRVADAARLSCETGSVVTLDE